MNFEAKLEKDKTNLSNHELELANKYIIENNSILKEIYDLAKKEHDNTQESIDKKKHPQFHFCKDGIVDPKVWFANDKKILFLFKEGYSNLKIDVVWDIRKWILGDFCGDDNICPIEEKDKKNHCQKCLDGKWGPMVKTVAKRAYNIIINDPEWEGEMTEEKRREILRQIAWVDVKKVYGQEKSNYYDLKYYTRKYEQQIKRQIKIINPDIIVCGGTFWFLAILFPEVVHEKFDYTDRKLWRGYYKVEDGDLKGKQIISTYHPTYGRGSQFSKNINRCIVEMMQNPNDLFSIN